MPRLKDAKPSCNHQCCCQAHTIPLFPASLLQGTRKYTRPWMASACKRYDGVMGYLCSARGQRGIAEEAEAHGHAALGVVPWRPHNCRAAARLAPAHAQIISTRRRPYTQRTMTSDTAGEWIPTEQAIELEWEWTAYGTY